MVQKQLTPAELKTQLENLTGEPTKFVGVANGTLDLDECWRFITITIDEGKLIAIDVGDPLFSKGDVEQEVGAFALGQLTEGFRHG